ncbi:hypothetical protein [Streptomyces corynorhini]|uniref:Uncharacterized protein n=1 Tax=Streptomyces corynorhini TaxID=2282652 RepID=A0A370AYD3_9ACTN|nr:hypothetical protein [Streptomyces corynorhini]RDG33462.1 hypothetical protein DVH02_31305 [Streptomyces corynorhini]
MPSVVGLLEERELAARVRAERLREEADRVLAELAEAETEWREWVIARQRVGVVLTAGPGDALVADMPAPVPAPVPVAVPVAVAVVAARPGRMVAVWVQGLDVRVLRENYRAVVEVLALARGADGLATRSAPEIAVALGMELTKRNIEGRVRHTAKRLVERGWLVELSPGRFRLADGPAAAS